MNRVLLCVSACGVLWLSVPVTAQPKMPPELKKLQFRIGKFKAVHRFPGGRWVQRSEGTWHGQSLEEHLWTTSDGHTWETVTLTSYDPRARQYRQHTLSSKGESKEVVGHMEGQTFVLEPPAPGAMDGTTGLYTTSVQGQRLRVAQVQAASSADRAGIRAGDIITTIDDQPAVNGWKLLGKERSTVRLTVLRAGKEHQYSLKREHFATKLIWEPRRGGGYRTSWANVVHGQATSTLMTEWQPDR